MKKQIIGEIYRDQTQMFAADSAKAIRQAFKNKKSVIAFTKDGFAMFDKLKEFKTAFDIDKFESKCGKLKIPEGSLQEFSDAVDFAQIVAKQIGCKAFIMNF